MKIVKTMIYFVFFLVSNGGWFTYQTHKVETSPGNTYILTHTWDCCEAPQYQERFSLPIEERGIVSLRVELLVRARPPAVI